MECPNRTNKRNISVTKRGCCGRLRPIHTAKNVTLILLSFEGRKGTILTCLPTLKYIIVITMKNEVEARNYLPKEVRVFCPGFLVSHRGETQQFTNKRE